MLNIQRNIKKTYYFKHIRPTRYQKALKYNLKVVNDIKKIDSESIVNDIVKVNIFKWKDEGQSKCFENLKVSKFTSLYFNSNSKSLKDDKFVDIFELNYDKISYYLKENNNICYHNFKIITNYFNEYVNCEDNLKIIYSFTGKLLESQFNNFPVNGNACYLLITDEFEIEKIKRFKHKVDDIVKKIKLCNNPRNICYKFKEYGEKCALIIKKDYQGQEFYNKNVTITFGLKLFSFSNFQNLYFDHCPINILEIEEV